MRKLTRAFAPIVFVLSLLLSGCALPMPSSSMVSMDELPAYSDSATYKHSKADGGCSRYHNFL